MLINNDCKVVLAGLLYVVAGTVEIKRVHTKQKLTMGNSRNIKGQSLTGRDTVVRGAARVPMRFYIVGKHKVPTDAPTAATTDVPMGVVKPRPTHMFSDGRSDGRYYLQHFSDGRPDGRSDGRCKLQHFSRRTLFSLPNFSAPKF